MKFKTLSLAALTLMGAIITACSSSDDTIADTPQPVITPQQPENTSKTVTLTTTVGFDDDKAGTRALTANGTKTFAAGDQIALIYTQNSGTVAKAVSAALPEGTYGKSAEFTFELTNPKTSEPVTYIYPAAMAGETGVDYSKLNSQSGGTLTDLGSKYDLATYTHAWDGNNLPTATLENQLAILAVTLKDYSGTSIITGGLNEVAVSAVTSEGTNTYTVTPTGSTFGEEVIYVAILPTAGATIKVTATDGTNNYVKTLTGKDYVINNGYNVSWLMTEATPLSETTPMTMEAMTDGTIVVNKPQSGMQYSKNGGAKTTMTGNTTITVSAGDKVEFYGNDTSIKKYFYGDSDHTTIAGSGDGFKCKVYGNIMSLVDETDFATKTSLPAVYTFAYFFSGNTNLTDASGLLLPATTLTESCYQGMFSGCSSLKTAPALNATTLRPSCYKEMFHGCTILETAPALPATSLPPQCYKEMFWGCTNLSAVTCLATIITQTQCTAAWLSGAGRDVTGTKTFTTPSTTDWSIKSGPDGIPSGWTRLNPDGSTYVAP